MPVNAPIEYFKAEEKFHSAKSKVEKIAALEEMLRLLPKHHGSETARSQLTSRLAKLRKEAEKKGGGGREGIKKEGDGQICVMGMTNAGKSTLLVALTDAKPAIGTHPFTTTEPAVGMMDYRGVKIQLIEIPSTFAPSHLSIARTADVLVVIANSGRERSELERLLADHFVRAPRIWIDRATEPAQVKEQIWRALALMVVYTRKGKQLSPMALPRGATIRDFAARVHKEFVRHFRFARVERSGRIMRAGLRYGLRDGDIVELFMA